MTPIKRLSPAALTGFGTRITGWCALGVEGIRRYAAETRKAWARMSGTERTLWLNRKLAFIATLGLIPALALMSIRLVRSLGDSHAIRWTPPANPHAVNRDPAGPDYRSIQSARLFGASASHVEEPANIIEAPPTTLALKLHGIVASADERFSHVIIDDGSGHEHIYFVKNEISGGIRIAAIRPDRVILDHAGQHETLWLPRYGDSPGTVRMAETLTTEPTEPEVLPGQNANEVIAPPPARLADIMMPRPHLKSGQFAGIEVYPGERREMFAALGLKPGDVIVRIDGRELAATDAAAPFLGLATDASFTFTIDRGGRMVTLKIANGAPVSVAANRPLT